MVVFWLNNSSAANLAELKFPLIFCLRTNTGHPSIGIEGFLEFFFKGRSAYQTRLDLTAFAHGIIIFFAFFRVLLQVKDRGLVAGNFFSEIRFTKEIT